MKKLVLKFLLVCCCVMFSSTVLAAGATPQQLLELVGTTKCLYGSDKITCNIGPVKTMLQQNPDLLNQRPDDGFYTWLQRVTYRCCHHMGTPERNNYTILLEAFLDAGADPNVTITGIDEFPLKGKQIRILDQVESDMKRKCNTKNVYGKLPDGYYHCQQFVNILRSHGAKNLLSPEEIAGSSTSSTKPAEVPCNQEQLATVNAIRGIWENGKCNVKECDNSRFDREWIDGSFQCLAKCDASKGEERDVMDKQCKKLQCSQQEKNAIGAETAIWMTKKATCWATKCKDGNKPVNGTCNGASTTNTNTSNQSGASKKSGGLTLKFKNGKTISGVYRAKMQGNFWSSSGEGITKFDDGSGITIEKTSLSQLTHINNTKVKPLPLNSYRVDALVKAGTAESVWYKCKNGGGAGAHITDEKFGDFYENCNKVDKACNTDEVLKGDICCHKCAPTNGATCQLTGVKNGECVYKTACDKSGYTLLNAGKYNATCDANGWNIDYNDGDTMWNWSSDLDGCEEAEGYCSFYIYGNAKTIKVKPKASKIPSGKKFEAWCTDKKLTKCEAEPTISASQKGDIHFYVKWANADAPSTTNNKTVTTNDQDVAGNTTASAGDWKPGNLITVTGTLKMDTKDDKDQAEALYGDTIMVIQPDGTPIKDKAGKENLGAISDANGTFEIKDVPSNAKLKIIAPGLTEKIVDAQSDMGIIYLEPAALREIDICASGDNNVAKWHMQDGECIPEECDNGYKIVDNKCVPKTADEFNITYELNDGDVSGCAKAPATYKSGETEIKCQPTKQGSVFNGWCYDSGLTDCERNDTFKITKTGDITLYVDWQLKDENPELAPASTEPSEPVARTECTEQEKAALTNATEFKFENGVCVPTACADGYNLENGKCVEDKIKKAQEKYDAAKENEQSLANRTLTSATMAATGIGGMELARGLAEQKADKAADADMTAYLSTFQCKVGDKRYSGNDTQIEIAGGNELIKLYQEYVDLANSLKERKAALGKKAGIESEVILDKANMGLYDETGKGIENGTYASLYRASKGNENDAAKIQEQKDASKKRVIAGAVVAGAGVVGGTIGNLAINGKKDSADNDEQEKIREKVATPKEKAAIQKEKTLGPKEKCEDSKSGGKYNETTKKCDCSSDKNKEESNGICVEKAEKKLCLDNGGEKYIFGACICESQIQTFKDGKCQQDADKVKAVQEAKAKEQTSVMGLIVPGNNTITNLNIQFQELKTKQEETEAKEKAEADQTVNDAFNNLIQGNKNNPLY